LLRSGVLNFVLGAFVFTVLIAVGSFVGYLVAYHTYGRWLSGKIFNLDKNAKVPSRVLNDDIDFVPTSKGVVFGHHFTSIAGTGPIVGPAIAVFWGWLPALLWVFFGSIFIGAVHDFGTLVISLRNRGETIGEYSGKIVAPRARILFLVILFMSLSIVLAVFGLVIAMIFAEYPETVLPVWITMPLAVALGVWTHRRGGRLFTASLIALVIVYASIYVGSYYLPIDLSEILSLPVLGSFPNIVMIWTVILLVYCAVASILPVWCLLQPRDLINSQQLIIVLSLLLIGVIVSALSGQADIVASAPMIATQLPLDSPPIFPFLFITIACGAVSGFHCLVSSGTSSKQIASEPDALYVGYGSMLLEGGLAIIVILACCAGIGMGEFSRVKSDSGYSYEVKTNPDSGVALVGREAWQSRYDSSKPWSSFRLKDKVGAFIHGGANFLKSIGIPFKLGVSLIAVLVAAFAATTLDSATRLQRYIIQEFGSHVGVPVLNNRFVATGIAVGVAGLFATIPASSSAGPGSGGLILWPLFGVTNQLLAGLAFMVIVFYLRRKNKPIIFALIPMVAMLVIPIWAMLWNMFNERSGWAFDTDQYHLLFFGVLILILQLWMIVEGTIVWVKTRGVLGLDPIT